MILATPLAALKYVKKRGGWEERGDLLESSPMTNLTSPKVL